ncbi:PREDICTED: protein-glutamine gamma-glutamyltransferase 5-like [Crocodylus porosus]|uniref:protein-glutamine gamma-glutamyltransferase 5-like n=1 Tax=Crocodylus porosus TaxID=8502 RepID=UPI00093E63D8|nr:PREDICTED: protein-glutamine gamma-glutamyltransferase 5-like [Crocodylus porosus]
MEVIQLGDVDLNRPHNCKCHNTHFFGTDRQTVRRGQAFDLYVHFQNREWDDSVDKISFTVETGLRPCESKEMKCTFPLGRCIDQTCWSACYKPHQHRCINISMFPPIDACIGRHILNMSITSCDRTFQQCLGDFDILFNPWCADDPVYMDNQAHREEYVLNEHGMLYEGVHKHVTSRPWHFGQFENGILDICLKVLDIGSNYHQGSERGCRWRNDPVHVSMVVNHMLCGHHSNSIMKLQDNNDYLKGTNPLTWNGSVPILQQWYNGRCRPVRFGDCLTLASVMCTVMRCLGIPSRVITNFCSPHCAENPLAVNELFDSTGKTLCGKDKLWAYHCWNESWMARRDLDLCSSNWQCLDPTPMESGRGSACCGPTSIRSVKDGELDLDYDGQHIFSRLNASCIGWLSKNSDKKEKLCYDAWLCGQCVSTKSVGNNHHEDITGAYKYELGSLKGKEAFYKAYRRIHSGYCNAPNCHIDRDLAALQSPFLSDAGVSMRFKMVNCPMYGQDVHLHWLLENLRNECKNLNFNLCTQVLTHNGCALDQFWKENINVALGPREAKTIPLHISYNQYGHHLGDHNIMRLVAISDPECGGEVLVVKRDIVINRPTVAVKLLGLPQLNEPCTAEISFCNPLQEDLKNCVLNLEGCGLFKEPMTIDLGTLASNHQTRTVVEFIPYRHGCHRLLANFACHKFGYCKGYANADVCDPRCNSVPFPVCNSGTLPVCDSGSLPHGDSYVDYMCIPMCTSGNGSGSQPTFDYVYLPVGHPLCSSLRPSDSGFHIICDTMPSAMSAPMFHSVSGSVSAPTSSPVGQVVGGSASAPIPHPVQPPMPYSLSIPANNAMSALLSHFMAGSANSSVCYPVHTPVSHTVSGTMPTSASHPPSGLVSHAACSSVSTPASHFLNAPVSHAACGFMSTPVSHPLDGPVSHAVSTPASHPICTPVSHAMFTPASRPICTPVSHAMSTPASRPICAPVSHAMSTPASRPICTPVSHAMSTPASHPICTPVSHAMSTPASHPICTPVSHSMYGLASTSVSHPLSIPVSRAMHGSISNATSRSVSIPLARFVGPSASSPVARSLSHSACSSHRGPLGSTVSRFSSQSAWVSRAVPASRFQCSSKLRSAYGTQSHSKSRSAYSALPHSASPSAYGTLTCSAWNCTL